MATMRLEIITAERVVYSDDVEALVAPGTEGDLGILPHHAALMTMLQPGELMVRKDGEETFLAVTGGFLEVMENRISILADAAERSEEIDEERAQEAMEQARERIAMRSADVDLEQALSQLRRANGEVCRWQGGAGGRGRSGGIRRGWVSRCCCVGGENPHPNSLPGRERREDAEGTRPGTAPPWVPAFEGVTATALR